MKTPLYSFHVRTVGVLIGTGIITLLGSCGSSEEKGSGKAEPPVKNLSWCAENGDIAGIKDFLNAGNINGEGDNQPPLLLAVSSGQAEMVSFLIKAGARIDISDQYGNYPIHAAASKGHVDVIKVLLAAGAKPDQESGAPYGDSQRMSIASEVSGFGGASDRYQPIHSAAAGNQPEAVRFFIGLGISPETKDGRGNNVLHYATSKWGWSDHRVDTIRLVDLNGEFEKAAARTISLEGYYITDEPTPKYIRFLPEKLVTYDSMSGVFPTREVVISYGARGGDSSEEIAKWLSPNNKDAHQRGKFITGTYNLMKDHVAISTFDEPFTGGDIRLSHENDQLRFSMRTMQAAMFSDGNENAGVACKFVSWK